MFNSMFAAADISASGMTAERMRMELVANNIANANSTQSADGTPYRRKELVFTELVGGGPGGLSGLRGVEVTGQVTDDSPLPLIYAPHKEGADETGHIQVSNVKIPNEMVDMITASRSYEANLKALTSFKEMVEQTLSLLRVGR